MNTSARITVVIALLWAQTCIAAVYQYAVASTTADGKEMTAYLWVPPDADRLRGILLAGTATSVEPVVCDDPIIRKACAQEKLGIVYFMPHLDALFGRDRAAQLAQAATRPAAKPIPDDPQIVLQRLLDKLAVESGYDEVATVPWFPIGHSVSTVYATLITAANPTRCFGALLHKGGIVITGPEVERALAGVPILVIKGQFEEFGPGISPDEDRTAGWKATRDTILRLRSKDPRYLISLLVEPGRTHFAWSPEYAPLVAQFIRDAAAARIPNDTDDAKARKDPVSCIDLEPTSGALARANLELDSGPASSSFSTFAGKPTQAIWFPSLALAQLADAAHSQMNKQPQFVSFSDPVTGQPVQPAHDLRMSFALKWTGPDTFTATALFLDQPSRKYPPLPAGQLKAGHAPGDVKVRSYGGQAEQIAPDTFRLLLDPRRRMEANLMAYHPGDDTYRYAEQGAILKLPKNLRGKPQSIAFPAVPGPLKPGSTVELAATSDAGLGVRYYIESGPAIVEGSTLRVTEIPRRARSPLKVVVVAYQLGQAIEPFVQAAEPARREVQVVP